MRNLLINHLLLQVVEVLGRIFYAHGNANLIPILRRLFAKSLTDMTAVIKEKELIIIARSPSSAPLIPSKVLLCSVPFQDMDEGLHEVCRSMKGLKLTDALINLF